MSPEVSCEKSEEGEDLSDLCAGEPKKLVRDLLAHPGDKNGELKKATEAMTLSMDYGYFATPAEKEKAVADATSQVQQLTEAQKIAQLGFIKSLMVLPPAENITETISGNSATVESVGSDGSKSTAKMIKDGGVWKLTQ